jgi:hypothetical protein
MNWMKYNKQDLPKIVALSVVLVGLIIYIGISYSREAVSYRRRAAEHEATHAQQAAAGPNAARLPGANLSMPAGAQMSPTVQALLTPISPPDRDPFLPVVARPRAFAALPVKSGAKARGSKRPSEPLVLPPLIEGASSQPPFQRDSNALALTGIVLGTPPLAVMRRGTDHFIVKQGAELPGKVMVQAISRNSVTLRDGKRQYTLKIGS